MHTYILKNSFHGTQARARSADGWLSARQIKRLRTELCGHQGCVCGGELGEQGPQEYDIEHGFDRDWKIIARLVPMRGRSRPEQYEE
jgi:hypothetical protein